MEKKVATGIWWYDFKDLCGGLCPSLVCCSNLWEVHRQNDATLFCLPSLSLFLSLSLCELLHLFFLVVIRFVLTGIKVVNFQNPYSFFTLFMQLFLSWYTIQRLETLMELHLRCPWFKQLSLELWIWKLNFEILPRYYFSRVVILLFLVL